MGIQDRDYARESWEGSPFGPPRWTATKVLVLANAIAFGLQLIFATIGGDAYDPLSLLSLRPRSIARGAVWQLVTSMFLHLDFRHVFFNMLGLWFFGHMLEERYGSRRFALFYFASGVFGGLVYVACAPLLGGMDSRAIGASGAVMGVIVLCAILYPREVVYLWVIIMIPVQMRFLALLFVVQDLLGFLGEMGGRLYGPSGGGVAYADHLGGALWGALFWLWRERWGLSGLSLPALSMPARKPKLQLVEPRREEGPDPEVRVEVDRILEKISRTGIDSLTAAEKAYLEQASREYRKK